MNSSTTINRVIYSNTFRSIYKFPHLLQSLIKIRSRWFSFKRKTSNWEETIIQPTYQHTKLLLSLYLHCKCHYMQNKSIANRAHKLFAEAAIVPFVTFADFYAYQKIKIGRFLLTLHFIFPAFFILVKIISSFIPSPPQENTLGCVSLLIINFLASDNFQQISFTILCPSTIS